jgi:hypothetical protein
MRLRDTGATMARDRYLKHHGVDLIRMPYWRWTCCPDGHQEMMLFKHISAKVQGNFVKYRQEISQQKALVAKTQRARLSLWQKEAQKKRKAQDNKMKPQATNKHKQATGTKRTPMWQPKGVIKQQVQVESKLPRRRKGPNERQTFMLHHRPEMADMRQAVGVKSYKRAATSVRLQARGHKRAATTWSPLSVARKALHQEERQVHAMKQEQQQQQK